MHDPADIALAFGQYVDKRLAIEAQRHCPPQIGVVEGRLVPVDDQIASDIRCDYLADGIGRLFLDVLQLRDRYPEIDVVLAGDERQQPRRYVLVDTSLMIVYSIPSR